jgi:acyl-coenzyme A thioesterase PaaI-like protein
LSSFKRQPNSAHCFVCGLRNPFGLKLRFEDNGIDQVRASYTVPAHFQGYPGVTHGGIVAAMLDETGGRTLMAANNDRFMMTGKLDIRYRKPVPVEVPLTLIGTLVQDRGRIAQVQSKIQLPDGAIAAEAEITLLEMPSAHLPEGSLEALGWKVYPD